MAKAGDGIVLEVDKRDIARLDKMLKSVPRKDAKKAIRKGTRAGAKIITAKAKGFAPVDSGATKRAVKTRAIKRSRVFTGTTTTVGAGFFKGKTFYAAFVELGYRRGKRQLGDRRTKVEGKHWMRKAVRTVGRKALLLAIDITGKEITKAAKRIAR